MDQVSSMLLMLTMLDVFITSSQAGSAGKCFQCISTTNGYCAEPFASSRSGMTCDGDLCVMAKYSVQGVTTFARGCYSATEFSQLGSSIGCQSATYEGHHATVCYCDTYMCNGFDFSSQAYAAAANNDDDDDLYSGSNNEERRPVECYQCTSTAEGDCADPFEESVLVRTCEGYVCMKIKYTYEGEHLVARGCYPADIFAKYAHSIGCYSDTFQGIAQADVCFCKNDKCNGAVMTSSFGHVTIMAATFISVIISQLM